jgi:Zn finger protein HypA/HybF involved in hydrogenase expression
MWTCIRCGEEVEEIFEVCWNCQANQNGVLPLNNPVSQKVIADKDRAIVNKKYKPMNCLRCRSILEYSGTKKLHQGVNWGALGDWGELLVGYESLEMYVCPECGHVEFFIFGG